MSKAWLSISTVKKLRIFIIRLEFIVVAEFRPGNYSLFHKELLISQTRLT